jgi:hypothetical protein
MAGWIEAWSRPVLSNPVMTISPQPMKIDSRDVVPTPSETATILANMALAAIRRNNP